MTRTTTTRGVLWEVLAPVVRWPMYSPMRLGLVIVALVAALVVVGQLTSDASSDQAVSATAGPRNGASSSPRGGTTSGGESSGTPDSMSEPVDRGTERSVSRLARRFVGSYLEPAGPQRAWLSRLQRMATRELGESLATVDRANVTALGRRVTGVEVRGVSSTAAAVVVQTDGSAFTVDVSHSGQEWQIARVTPVDPGDREAA